MKIQNVRTVACIFALHSFTCCFSQKIKFVERESNNPIDFCKVLVDKHVLFCDEKGVLDLTGLDEKTKVFVDDFRYNREAFNKPKSDSIIRLESNPLVLEDVTIISKRVFESPKDKKSGYSHSFIQGIEYGFLVENQLGKSGRLMELKLYPKRILKNCMIHLKIYNSIDESKESAQPLGFIDIPIQVNKSENELIIDVSGRDIYINDNSFFLLMRIYDASGDYLKSISYTEYLSLNRSRKNTKKYLYRKNKSFEWTNTEDTGIGISYSISY